jgi:lipoprotein-releasing system permease protein
VLPYELLIGLRYTRAKRRNHFISFISVISMAGIALGVMALIVVLSVMNGFQEELRGRILGVASHMEISGPGGQPGDWPGTGRAGGEAPGGARFRPLRERPGPAGRGGETKGAMVRGLLPAEEGKVAEFAGNMKSGRLDHLRPGEFNIILGSDLARPWGSSPATSWR